MERYRASFAIALAGLCMANNTIFGAVNVCDEASLRAAVAAGGHITFNCDATILITSTLVVTQNVTLDASGRSVALSGNRVRIVEVTNGATLQLINLTLDRGLAEGTNGAIGQVGGRGAGAGVLLAPNATLIATGCHFSNNRAVGGRGGDGHTGMGLPARPGGPAEGGAIFGGANLFLTNCMFTFNTATGGLGGILPGAPEMESTGSGLGGCISMADGVLAVANSLFTSNSATAGGAIYFAQRRGTVSNCRFVANTTRVSGGAIYHDADSLVVTDSRFLGNATSGHPALGGAIRQGFG
jgi:predicted outer membrane repeat protein